MSKGGGGSVDYMDFMYRVIEEMARLKIPVVFKGALVLNQALKDRGMPYNFRQTKDIDLNWLAGEGRENDLIEIIEGIVYNLGLCDVTVVCDRKASKELDRSARIVVKRGGTNLFSLDISLRENPFVVEYKTPNGVIFLGSSLDKIFADKVRAISSKAIFRRAKDLYDLYIMSMLDGYSIKATLEVYAFEDKSLGDFDSFISRLDDLKYAYDRLEEIINKPFFNDVYARVRDFCLPFITGDYIKCTRMVDGVWNSQASMWIETY